MTSTSLSKKELSKIVFQLSGLLHTTVDLLDPEDSDLNNITLSQGKALFCLFNRYPEGMMLKDIAREMKVTAGFASPTVEVLVKHGLVERFQKEGDRRAVLFRPSKKSLEMYKKREKIAAKLCKKLVVGCDEEEVAVFEKILFLTYQKLQVINQKLQEKNC